MKATDETTLKAFLIAIDRLDPPLAAEDYPKINQIGIAIAQKHSDQAISMILDLIQTYPHLRDRYDTARLNLKQHYQAQERSKSAVATLEKTGTDLEQTAIVLLTSFQYPSSTLFTDSSTQSKDSDFWEKGDRVVAIIAGGAFLGGTVGQVPGAIVGAVLAAIYGWYTSSAKYRPVGTRR